MSNSQTVMRDELRAYAKGLADRGDEESVAWAGAINEFLTRHWPVSIRRGRAGDLTACLACPGRRPCRELDLWYKVLDWQ